MPSIRIRIAALFLGFCLGAPLLQAAETPTSAEVQSALENLAERKLPEAEQLALKQTLEKTLSLLSGEADSKKRMADLKKQLEQAPRLIATAQRELARLKASKPTDVAQQYGNSAVPQLERQLSERNTQLSEWQKQMIEANSLIVTAQTRPERAQAEISSNQVRTQEINDALKSDKDAGKALTPERRNLLKAELAQLNARVSRRCFAVSSFFTLQAVPPLKPAIFFA